MTETPDLSEFTGRVHRTDCVSLLKKLPDESVQAVFADPPFNLAKKYSTYKDDMEFSEYLAWTKAWLRECHRVLKPDGSLFVYNIPKLLTHTAAILDELMEFKHWISWNAAGKPLGKSLQPAHYGILYYAKTAKPKFYEIRIPHPACKRCGGYVNHYGGQEWRRHPFGVLLSDVWSDIMRVRHNSKRIDNHPCQLPVHLLERIILMSTDEGDVFVDPFCGGGAGAVAAVQTGRRYIGTDIDPGYVDAVNAKMAAAQPVFHPDGYRASYYLGKVVSVRDIDLPEWQAVKPSPKRQRESSGSDLIRPKQ